MRFEASRTRFLIPHFSKTPFDSSFYLSFTHTCSPYVCPASFYHLFWPNCLSFFSNILAWSNAPNSTRPLINATGEHPASEKAKVKAYRGP
jgi:hypothetical protein